MRICLFGTRMDMASGHSRPAFELASGLIERGHDVRLLSTALSPASQTRLDESLARSPRLARVPIYQPIAGLGDLLQVNLHSRTSLMRMLADCDLIHGFSLYASIMLNDLAPAQGPHVLTLNTDFRPSLRDFVTLLTHAPHHLRQPRYSASVFVPAILFRKAFMRFGHIICWTEFLRDKLLSLGIPAGKLAKIPVGIDMPGIYMQSRRDSGGSPLFLYSGAVSRLRGIAVLIHAFRMVKNMRPGAKLIVADRGPHTARDVSMHAHEVRYLSRQIDDLGLTDSVTRSEFGGDLSAWTNACDAVVLPFNTTIGYSQPPLTLLEAMAHGKPVITTRIGSIPEHVRDGVSGVLVAPGNAEELARAMIELTPEDGERMGNIARLQIASNHSWSHIVPSTEAIYSSTLAQ